MKKQEQNGEPGNFTNDPEEDLRMENELLKLKMQAERGGVFVGGEDIPPEIENDWLQNILRFEEE